MTALPTHVGTLVVGSGFGGIAAAVRLRQAGHEVAVVERASEVGGTWRDNSYPGCACDVPSHLYSFSFAPNPTWSRTFSPQPEIYAYLRRVADEHGLRQRTWFDTEVQQARWDGSRWLVSTSRGDLTADVLVLGTGPLSAPVKPSIPGLDTFAGTVFHSADWDHSHRFENERVAVIGTGASAIQFAPEVAKTAGHLTVFQRTAPWILPRRDRAILSIEKKAFARYPAVQKAVRGGIYGLRESWILGFTHPAFMKQVERLATRYLRTSVADPGVRAKVTPDYRLGCKRVLLSNTWYPMLNQPNVDLVTESIAEITPTGIVTTTGKVVEVDTLLLGTGFSATDQPIAHQVQDAAGRTLAEHWQHSGMSAYRGLTVSGFPNLFVLAGPNTGIGHTSLVYVIERQVEHLVEALATMRSAGLQAISPRKDVTDAFNARVQQDLQGTVWNAGGCASWYLDEHGKNTTLWPTFSFRYAQEVKSFDLADYDVHPVLSASAAASS